MNFRSCKYFLAVCEMGTINAAARKLYISPQSLSQHIRKIEEELDAHLFHRDNPMTLTEAGLCVKQAATDILGIMSQMEQNLAQIKGNIVQELTIGLLDYGIPEFLPPLIDQFLKLEPNVLLKTRDISTEEALPPDVPLIISANEMGGSYKSELLFSDSLVVCVRDDLLKQLYGTDWQERKNRLEQGDLTALEGCPFVRQRNAPFDTLTEMVFTQNHFTPDYLPVMGTPSTLSKLCLEGHAAMITFLGQATADMQMKDAYRIANVPESVPASYISYRTDSMLNSTAQQFLDITRRYFKRK